MVFFNPHYSPNLVKMNSNAGYPSLVETNFGQQNWLCNLIVVGDSNYSNETFMLTTLTHRRMTTP